MALLGTVPDFQMKNIMINQSTNLSEAYCDEGDHLIEQRRFRDARHYFNLAIQTRKDNFRAWQGMGRAWRFENVIKSTKYFKHAINLQKNDAWNHLYLANVLSVCEKFEEARIEYNIASTIDNSTKHWLDEFEDKFNYIAIKKSEIDWLKKSATIKPTVEKLSLITNAFLNYELYFSAAKWARRYIKLSDDKYSNYLAGLAYEHINIVMAKNYLNKCIEYDNKYKNSIKALDRIQQKYMR